jgi:hypothetical protein
VLNENRNNIINYIITIIIFVEILQFPFSDESVLNEILPFNITVNFTQSLYLHRNVCHIKGHLRFQDSLDAPVQLSSFSPVQEVIYFTAACVKATSRAEDLPSVIGKSEAVIPCRDYIPSWDMHIGEFPHQPRRHDHLQLHTTKSKFRSVTKFISLLVRSSSPTQKNPSKFPMLSFLPLQGTDRTDGGLRENH